MKIELDIDCLGECHRECKDGDIIRKHKWGYERWIVNEPEYCLKLLVLENGEFSSLHYHKKKKETFIVLSGEVGLEGNLDITKHTISGGTVLKVGDTFNIPVGMIHQFYALQVPSVILEISEHHEDSDTYRVEDIGYESRAV